MSKINDLFVKNSEEKASLVKTNEQLERAIDELQRSRKQAEDQSLRSLQQKDAEMQDKDSQMQEKDAQIQEMAEVIEYLEQMMEEETNKNGKLVRSIEAISNEYEELKEEYEEKVKQLEEEQQMRRGEDEIEQKIEEKNQEWNGLLEELQNLVKINEGLEIDVVKKKEVIEKQKDMMAKQNETISKLMEIKEKYDNLQRENEKDRMDKGVLNKDLERMINENWTLQKNILAFQEKYDKLAADNKIELKEKDQRIESLIKENSDTKEHMQKSIELWKIAHSNEVKSMQARIEQIESDKNQYFYELQGSRKDLEKVEKGQVEELKRELLEVNDRLKDIMNEWSSK